MDDEFEPGTQHCNAAGIDIIKRREVFYANPYQDYGGTWTQGYGHTKGIGPDSPPCTMEEALEWLREDVKDAQEAINRLVRYELTDNEFSALVSFVFNIGETQFRRSSALKALNTGDFEKVGVFMALWNKDAGKVMNGLVERRAEEAELFYTVDPEPAMMAEAEDINANSSG